MIFILKTRRRTKYLQSISKKLIDSNINVVFQRICIFINYYEKPYLRPYNDFDILIMTVIKVFIPFWIIKILNIAVIINFYGSYTRTALEVINSDIDVPFDFHHRFVTKFLRNIVR